MMHNPMWARYQREEHERMLRELASRPRFDRLDRPKRLKLRERFSWLGAKPAQCPAPVRT